MKKLFVAVLIVMGLCLSAPAQDMDPALEDNMTSQPMIVAQNIALDLLEIYKQLIYENVDINKPEDAEGIAYIYETYFKAIAENGIVADYKIVVNYEQQNYIELYYLVNLEKAKWAVVRFNKDALKNREKKIKIPPGKAVLCNA